MNNRYKNITKPLVIIAIIFLVLSVFARSSFRRFNYSGNRGYINRCNQPVASAEAKIEEKAVRFEEKMDRAEAKFEEKMENFFD